MKIWPILFFILLNVPANAEYRVYQYFVKSTYPKTEDQKAYIITSTLDPISYQAYHGGKDVIKIDLVRSWICLGHTGQKRETCPPPSSNSRNVAGGKTN
jgi:hypothetical protein